MSTLRITMAAVALSACTSGGPAMASSLDQAFVTSIQSGDEDLGMAFLPGREHLLRVAPEWSSLAVDRIEVVVDKLLPDGRCVLLQSSVDRGAAATLPLGPLCMPPVFQFEAGVVYRRGYSLDIRVRDTEGRCLLSQSFTQGIGKTATRRGAGDAVPAGVEHFVPDAARRLVYLHQYGVEAASSFSTASRALRSPRRARTLTSSW